MISNKLFTTLAATAFAATFLSGCVSTGSTSTASAEPKTYAYDTIRAGDWEAAEAQLRAAVAEHPDDPLHMINLAYVLKKTGRVDEAAELYRAVLVSPSNPYAAVRDSDAEVKGRRVKAIAQQALADIEG